MFGTRSARRLLVNGLAAGLLIAACLAAPASASHFRGGDINYSQIGGTTSTQAAFQATQSYRCTFFFAACPPVGTAVALGGFDHGDGTLSPGSYVVVASNSAEDYFTARETTSHTYPNLTRRTASYIGCCTISSLLNNSDASYRLFVDVNLAGDRQSPRTSLPPVVNVGAPGVQTFFVAASDPGGQTLRWRLATDTETLGFGSNPPDFTVNPSTGLASFDTTGKTPGLYHASVVIEALAGGSVVSATQTTFLIRVGSGVGNRAPVYVAPTPADGSDFTVAPGTNLSIPLRATDPDTGDTVDIVPGPLPAGATFNDTPGNPATGTFSLTPTAAQNNQDFILNFTAQDGNGGSALRSYTVRVRGATNVPPTVTITTPPPGALYLPGQNVIADYACADSDGTVASCVGPVADGQPINTATSGNKTFSVTATDNRGATTTRTVSYRVGVVAGLCRGTVMRILSFDPATANPRETPCVTRTKRFGDDDDGYFPWGSVLGGGVLEAKTIAGPTSARAEAYIANLTVRASGEAIRIRGLYSRASATLNRCGPPVLTGTSDLASVSVGSRRFDRPGRRTYGLRGGLVHFNQTIRSGNTIIQRALFVDLPGTSLDIVIGEAKAGIACS